MDRREFIAGSLACSPRRGAKRGPAWAQSGPLTQDHLSVRGRRQRRHGVPAARAISPPMLDRNFIVESRTGGDGLIGIRAGEGCGPRRHHHPGDDGPDHVPAADGGERAELRSRRRISSRSRSSPASNSWSSSSPLDRRDRFQAAGGLGQGQSVESELRRADRAAPFRISPAGSSRRCSDCP